MKQYYTDKKYKELLTHVIITMQTNEQKNQHIKDFFDKKGYRYKDKAIPTGDYCFMIEACPELGFLVDTYYTDELFIERKNSLSELASSINNETFHYELKRAQNIKHKFLLVEQEGGWQDLQKHEYRSEYSPAAFWGTLHTFEIKYGLKIEFLPKELMGAKIYSICKAVLDSEILK